MTFSINVALLFLTLWAIHRGLYRRVIGRSLSGTCRAIACELELPVWLVRGGFLAALAAGAHAILAYLVLDVALAWHPEQRSLLLSSRLWNKMRGLVAR
jgi:phage shock protein PspC (stress-responsive transcriptional regulator)